MEEAGGWNDRTTVEDMDLAVRASLCGWKFVYIHDLECKNELPSTFKAFRFQQHRWSCGPANLFRKVLPQILKSQVNSWLLFGRNQFPSINFISFTNVTTVTNSNFYRARLICLKTRNWLGFWVSGHVQKVKLWKRLHMIYAFFFVRKIVAHIVTFTFYCVVIPASVLVPEVDLPFWGAVYVPSTITLLNAITTPKWVIPFQLFSQATFHILWEVLEIKIWKTRSMDSLYAIA